MIGEKVYKRWPCSWSVSGTGLPAIDNDTASRNFLIGGVVAPDLARIVGLAWGPKRKTTRSS